MGIPLQRAVVVAIGALASAAPLAAQERPTSIPVELATALIGGGMITTFTGAPRFAVGRAPAGFPPALVPPAPARIIGGMWSGDGGSLVVGLATPVGEAAGAIERFLTEAGWRRPDLEEERTGFLPSQIAAAAFLCKGDEMVTFAPVAGAAVGTHVRINYLGDAMSSSCRARRSARTPLASLQLPKLRAPAGAISSGNGGGTGGDRLEASTRLTVRLTATALAAHYAAQLDSAGWKVGPAGATPDAVLRPLEVTDAKGHPWRGTLLAIALGAEEHDVSIRMHRLPSPR